MTKQADILHQLIDSAGSHLCSVTFTKANGEERQLTFNPKQIGEILGTGKPNTDPELFRIVEHKTGQWRSFKAERVLKIKVNGTITTF